MSSRMVRRFRGKDSFLEKVSGEESETEPDLTNRLGARRKDQNVNPFDVLNESEVEDTKAEDSSGTGDVAADIVCQGNANQKKKKKKKKRKKYGKLRDIEDGVDETVPDEFISDEDPNLPGCSNSDPKDRSLECLTDLEKVFRKPFHDITTLLNVTPRNLKAINEMKKIFGSKIVEKHSKRRKDRGKGFRKKYMFIDAPKETWPYIQKIGLSMRMEKTEYGTRFAFTHDETYQKIQRRFIAAVQSLNPDNIVQIANEYPYHVDTLLQLSEMCKISEDLQMAADLNERALYCLESAYHPLFNIVSGNCLLDYRQQENRAFYICLFRHMIFVGQRGCYETAFEICKALLCFDFERDPLAVVLCVDFYALRAGFDSWLLSAATEFEATRLVSQLPNFAYSVALALFRSPSPVAQACGDTRLQNALIAFPSVLIPLLKMCSIQVDERVANHPYFNTQTSRESKPLSWLAILYVHRSYHEWKVPNVLPWLERNVHAALDRIDNHDPLIQEWKKKRLRCYSIVPRNVLRHIILSDIKEVLAAVGPEINTPYVSFDPLPPVDSIDSYTSPPRRSLSPPHTNPFSLFFRSLLPSFNVNNYGQAPPDNMVDIAQVPQGGDGAAGRAAQGAEGGEGVGDDLRNSVGILMNAIVAMLRHAEEPRGSGDDDDDDDDDNNNGVNGHNDDDNDDDSDDGQADCSEINCLENLVVGNDETNDDDSISVYNNDHSDHDINFDEDDEPVHVVDDTNDCINGGDDSVVDDVASGENKKAEEANQQSDVSK